MQATAIQFIKAQAQYLDDNRHQLVIDADAYATDIAHLAPVYREKHQAAADYYYGRPLSAEDLLTEMKMASVDMAMIWQNPAATLYTGETGADHAALLAANRYIYEAARIYPQKFIPGGWVDPQACGAVLARQLVDTLILDWGFLLVKINPVPDKFALDSKPVLAVADRVVELGGIPVFHFRADLPLPPAGVLANLAERYVPHPILVVHMGSSGCGDEAVESLYRATRKLGLKHGNLHFVLNARREAYLESDLIACQVAGEPFCRNQFCASDAPYGRMTWNFGGFRWVFKSLMDGHNHTDPRVKHNPGLFTWETTRNYMGRNFADFAATGYRRLLQKQKVGG